VVRTPSPGGGDAALALPPGSLEQKPAKGAPLFFRNGSRNRPHCSGVPPINIGNRPRTVPSIVKVMLAFTLYNSSAMIAISIKPAFSPPAGAGMHLRKKPAATMAS
jgi:hypothetical protein